MVKLAKALRRRFHLYVEWRPVIVVRVSSHPDRVDPLDEAMWTVRLEGNWRWVTQKMTTPAREAAVEAVLRYDRWFKADDSDEHLLTRESLVWWE
jgi:hypothetical protein